MSRFERLYRENFPFVWAAARRCGAPDAAVGDVVQDVFVTAHRRLDELSYEVSPRGWLYGVTRRVAFRYRRSAARTARRKAGLSQRGARVEQPHARFEAAQDLEQLLERVDADQREAFVMAELLGMSGPEIAGELGIPLNTVYSRLRLARRRLERLASPEAIEPGLQAARRGQAPPSGQPQRTWAMMAPILSSPWTGVKLGLITASKSLWLPIAVVTAIAVTVAVRSDAPGEPSEAAAQAQAQRAIATAEPTGASRHGGSAAEAAIPVAPPIEAAERTDGPANTMTTALPRSELPTGSTPAAASTVGASAAGASPSVASPSSASPVPAPPSADALAAEVAQLEAVRRAITAGDPDRALTLLRALDERFGPGQLADARQAARVRALCAAGRTQEAEREAASLHREHPTSNVARATAKTCDGA